MDSGANRGSNCDVESAATLNPRPGATIRPAVYFDIFPTGWAKPSQRGQPCCLLVACRADHRASHGATSHRRKIPLSFESGRLARDGISMPIVLARLGTSPSEHGVPMPCCPVGNPVRGPRASTVCRGGQKEATCRHVRHRCLGSPVPERFLDPSRHGTVQRPNETLPPCSVPDRR